MLENVKRVKLGHGEGVSAWFTAESLSFHGDGLPGLGSELGLAPDPWVGYFGPIPPPHPEQLIVSFISVLSIGPVTVNSITLGPWRVILDQQCVVELPALMEWSLSVSSNIVGHWPLECGYCNRN